MDICQHLLETSSNSSSVVPHNTVPSDAPKTEQENNTSRNHNDLDETSTVAFADNTSNTEPSINIEDESDIDKIDPALLQQITGQ